LRQIEINDYNNQAYQEIHCNNKNLSKKEIQKINKKMKNEEIKKQKEA